jgi:peptide/nickel transport system substrate-binding protein
MRRSGVVSWIVPLVLLVAACGPSNVAPGTSTAATGVAVKPASCGTFTYLQSRDIASLDPLSATVSTVPQRISLVYPRLINYDYPQEGNPADAGPVPGYITDKWTFSDGGKTLTFNLRKGVKYPNIAPVNGRELVANDVKFSINRYMTDPTSTFASRYADVSSIETPDDYTVVFRMKQPSSFVIYALAGENAFITPPEVLQQNKDYKQVAIGAGPYIHEQTTPGEGSTFRKNPDFVNASNYCYDRVVFKVVTDAQTRLAALRSGQADWADGDMTKSELDAFLGSDTTLKSFKALTPLSEVLFFNLNNTTFKDMRARLAISKAIDRQAIIDRVHSGAAVYGGPVTSAFGKWALPQDELKKFNAYMYDPVEAKRLWSQLSSPPTTIQIYTNPRANIPYVADTADLVAQQLQQNLGIKVNLATEEYLTFATKCYSNKFPDICVFAMSANDPYEYMQAKFAATGTKNGAGLNDGTVNSKLDEIRQTIDDPQRVQKALDFQRYQINNVLSMADLPERSAFSVYPAALQNVRLANRPPGIEWLMASWKKP